MSQAKAPDQKKARWYWEQYDADETPPGGDLALLRKGVGRQVGDVWEMARFYRALPRDGAITNRLAAEHAALSLFATHQQSRRRLMHQPDVPFGAAARALHTPPKKEKQKNTRQPREDGDGPKGKFAEQAVDRRMYQIATAAEVGELVTHLRGLVVLLRSIDQPLDYNQLLADIERWHSPGGRARVRSRWGGQYFARHATDGTDGAALAAGA